MDQKNVSPELSSTPSLSVDTNISPSDEIAGPDGPLAQYGLVSDPELAATQEMVAEIN
jgi:phosphate transport system substrate-binding protein